MNLRRSSSTLRFPMKSSNFNTNNTKTPEMFLMKNYYYSLEFELTNEPEESREIILSPSVPYTFSDYVEFLEVLEKAICMNALKLK